MHQDEKTNTKGASDEVLVELIRALGESARLDRSDAADRRTFRCLGMRRIETLAAGPEAPVRGERAHLHQCPICRGRLRAFERLAPAQRPLSLRGPHRGRKLVEIVATAAAACLALLVLLRGGPDAGTDGRVLARSVPLSVCYEPDETDTTGARIARFPTLTEEPCFVLAVFREWDPRCGCLLWELHEWDEHGHTLAALDPVEGAEIRMNVTDDPPLGQLLVIASSRDGRGLPQAPEELEALLQCLNESAPPARSNEDLMAYADAVESCLPAGVTVVPQPFYVD